MYVHASGAVRTTTTIWPHNLRPECLGLVEQEKVLSEEERKVFTLLLSR